MKKHINLMLIVLVLGLFSCKTYKERSYWENGKKKSVISRSKRTHLYDGKYTEYYNSGKRKIEKYYKYDLPAKYIKEWYENGQLNVYNKIHGARKDTIFEIMDDLLIQTHIAVMDYSEVKYYENGKLAYRGEYKENKKEGHWLYTDSITGSIKEVVYRNDSIVR